MTPRSNVAAPSVPSAMAPVPVKWNFQMKLKGDSLIIRLRGPRAEEVWRAVLDAASKVT